MRLVFLDTETTGFNRSANDVTAGHAVIELACVETIDGIITNNYFHSYIKTDKEIDPKAGRVHGITKELLENRPTFKEIAARFMDFVANDVIVMHNASFDIAFLNNELMQSNLPCRGFSYIDSLKIARDMFPLQDNRLSSLCKRLGVQHHGAHSALGDAFALAEVYHAMERMI